MKIQEFKARANTHQTHTEDLVLLGSDGLAELNDKIEKLIKQIKGESKDLNVTVKIDGAPALQMLSNVEGYPRNCIGLKSLVSNASNAISSYEQIESKYGDRPDMATKLRYGLELAHSIPSGEIWQGDCLFSKNDLKEVEINGKLYLTFHPNKIVYAVSEDNESYEAIKNADFGICFHTIYKNGGQSFNVDVSRLMSVPDNIYVMSPALPMSHEANDYNLDEVEKQYEQLKQLEDKLLNNSDYEDLCSNTSFMSYWNTFENANLSDKQAVTLNVNTFYNDLVDYIKNKQQKEYDKKMSTLKTDKGRQSATDKFAQDTEEMANILEHNKGLLVDLVNCLNLAAEIKMNLWYGLRKSKQDINTFYKHREKGYIPADMEGVSVSDSEGNITKIVDRSKFSNVNRDPNYMSGFEHESLEESKLNEDVNIDELIDNLRFATVYDSEVEVVDDWGEGKDILAEYFALDEDTDEWEEVAHLLVRVYDEEERKGICFREIWVDEPYLHYGIADKLVKACLDAIDKSDLVLVHFDLSGGFWPHMKKKYPQYNWDKDIANESLQEDTKKKRNGRWVNKGKGGEHGEFKTKKEADAQRRAMFARGYHEELEEDTDNLDYDFTNVPEYLYHATKGDNLNSIKQNGLEPGHNKNYEFSRDNVIDLDLDPYEAGSFADEGNTDSGVYILKIDTNKLDKSHLAKDRNSTPWEEDDILYGVSWEYDLPIDKEAIVNIEVYRNPIEEDYSSFGEIDD